MNLALPIQYATKPGNVKTIETHTLINSGAGGVFMNTSFTKKYGLKLRKLALPTIPKNVDGTLNIGGKITHCAYADVLFNDRRLWTQFLITNIGKHDLILGLPWLKEVNPKINWKTGKIKLPERTLQEQVKEV